MESLEIIINKSKIILKVGDITDQETDAIVNAANSTLMGGRGVDGAIHRKGGPKIRFECKKIRETEWIDGLPPGKAVITTGGNLKAKYVIHTVGPMWRGGNRREPELLADAYLNSLKLAAVKGLKKVSFPSISTGAFLFPIDKASIIALLTIKEFLETESGKLDEVVMVLFSLNDFNFYITAARKLFPEKGI
ncbi:MAG: O-acetyl-ADP-ribose deacetylase [Promethearchaeota archaeon]